MEQTRKKGFANRVLQGIILLLLVAFAAGAFTTEVNAASERNQALTDVNTARLKTNEAALKSDAKSGKPKATVKIGKQNVTKKTYSLKKGSKATIKVSTANLKGKKKIKFVSSNKKVAAVTKKGTVKAKKTGTAKIKITVTAGKKKVSAWTKIKVVKQSKSPGSKDKNPAADTPENSDNNQQPGQNPVVKPDDPPSESVRTDSDILVAYFSCTGTTKSVAEHAASYLNGDLYGITPQVPYSNADLDYRTDYRANQEQKDPSVRPAISGSVKNMAQYDTIILGYPIWQGQAPRIISKSYDFSGKTIVPFCTSGGSGLGTSASNLHGLVDSGAAWKTGIRFGAGASSSDVQTWLKSEGIQPFTGGSTHAI